MFDLLAYVAGFGAYFWLRRGKDPLPPVLRLVIVAAATTGSVLGAKLLYLFEDPQLTIQHLHDPAYLLGGKTIVGALLGGLIAVEVMKHSIGLHQSTGDLFAIPLALGIAAGRVGCFLTGLSDNTYGTPTSLAWGIDFGNGVRRHPTQLYEVVFLLGLVPVLSWVMRQTRAGRRFRSGDVFKSFMVAYMGFRLLCDFLKPYPRVALGLGAIQWACLAILFYYANDVWRWLTPASASGPVFPSRDFKKSPREI